MSPYTFVVIWIVQASLLGLVALALPRLLRVRTPGVLETWWAWGALAVVALPVVPMLLPAAPTPPAALLSFVDTASDVLATTSTTRTGHSPSTWLAIVWGSGVMVRVGWLWHGQRCLRRLAATGERLDADPMLAAARGLVADAAGRPSVRRLVAEVPVIVTPAAGPCVFGWWHPSVLVPAALARLPDEQRLSVYLHELMHVQRRDVVRAYVDEVWRLAWWWQPAVWWMVSRLRLSRELLVDRAVVTTTGARRPYVEALMWCGERRQALAIGPQAGGGRHVLVQRVRLLCQEVEMSSVRRWSTVVGLGVVFAAVSGVVGVHSPLGAMAQDGAAVVMSDAGGGPLERTAVRPSLDVPAPRRVRAVAPDWTPPAGTALKLRVHAVVDATGRVAEARVVGTTSSSAAGSADGRAVPDVAPVAVLEAVRAWEFEAPLKAPMLIATDVVLGDAALLQPTKTRSASPGKVLRAGGNIPPPTKVYDVPARYPAEALEAKVQGIVVVECTVGPDGTVTDTNVVSSVPLLDAAAVEAVRQWRYTPTLLNGVPVPIVVTVTVNFTLK